MMFIININDCFYFFNILNKLILKSSDLLCDSLNRLLNNMQTKYSVRFELIFTNNEFIS